MPYSPPLLFPTLGLFDLSPSHNLSSFAFMLSSAIFGVDVVHNMTLQLLQCHLGVADICLLCFDSSPVSSEPAHYPEDNE